MVPSLQFKGMYCFLEPFDTERRIIDAHQRKHPDRISYDDAKRHINADLEIWRDFELFSDGPFGGTGKIMAENVPVKAHITLTQRDAERFFEETYGIDFSSLNQAREDYLEKSRLLKAVHQKQQYPTLWGSLYAITIILPLIDLAQYSFHHRRRREAADRLLRETLRVDTEIKRVKRAERNDFNSKVLQFYGKHRTADVEGKPPVEIWCGS